MAETLTLIQRLKLRWRYWRARRAFIDGDVLAIKSPEQARLEADLWQDVDPAFADMLRSFGDDVGWDDSIPEGHGRCGRCGWVVPIVQSPSGMWKTAQHFGCLGSLVEPHG